MKPILNFCPDLLNHLILVATNRKTSGEGYKLLKKALDRLKGVSVKTNIKTNKREITSAFGLIESYNIVESSRVKKRMVKLEITLSDWFYNSILGKEVLTINRDYFRLGKALERRLYEIARKYCGRQDAWQIRLTKLKEKTGSTSHLDKFRYFIRAIAKSNHLPDYRIQLDEDDKVHFFKTSESLPIDEMPTIQRRTIEKGRKLTENSGKDFNAIHQQFSLQLLNGFKPDNVDGAFIGFVKKKIGERD
ncbi:MAG: replication initiator protein A [Bacteroidota bacterium]